MRVAIFHGFELTGSGSNEYTRYLSRALARQGHDVHVLCREPDPAAIPHVARAFAWDASGKNRRLFSRDAGDEGVTLHQLANGAVRPVYVTDKQRAGNVKAFESLTDDELSAYHAESVRLVDLVLREHPVELVHANHLVWQPCVLAETSHPFIVFPHGSAIEYTIRRDDRYRGHAAIALSASRGIISGNQEVLDRILDLYPDERDALQAKGTIVGVGVDTSLFRPVIRSERRETVSRVQGALGGKTVAQSRELVERLERGELDAVTRYCGAYDQAVSDEQVKEKIARIPWDEGRVLLFVGALTAGKGIQTLLCALPAILREHSDTHLVIVGSGAYREVLEALVHANAAGRQGLFDYLVAHGFDLDRSELTGSWEGLSGAVPTYPGFEEHVHFLGRLPHALLQFVAPCADLAIFPSVLPEAYPLVLMESLAAGVLPLVSDFSGFADGLNQLEGFLGRELTDRLRLPFDPDDRVEGLVDRVCGLLRDFPDEETQGRLRTVAVEHFDWDIRAREMAAAYLRFAAPS